MTNKVFVDTSGWASLFVRTKPFHADADRLMRRWRAEGATILTSNYVITELAALLTSPLRVPRPSQIRLLATIRTSRWIEVVHIGSDLDEEAWELFRTRPDKSWSLVDCASFVLMNQRGLLEALTTDRHFEQAGFVRVLRR